MRFVGTRIININWRASDKNVLLSSLTFLRNLIHQQNLFSISSESLVLRNLWMFSFFWGPIWFIFPTRPVAHLNGIFNKKGSVKRERETNFYFPTTLNIFLKATKLALHNKSKLYINFWTLSLDFVVNSFLCFDKLSFLYTKKTKDPQSAYEYFHTSPESINKLRRAWIEM